MTESEKDRLKRLAREAKEQRAAQDRSLYERRIGDRLGREADREVESKRNLEDYVEEYLGGSVGDIDRVFGKDMPDAQVMRDFNKIKRARGGRRKRLVQGAPGRRVKRAYKKRKGCKAWALVILASVGATLTLSGWGAYELVNWAL